MSNSLIRKDNKMTFKSFIKEYSFLFSFLLLLVVAIVVNPQFLKWSNITNLFLQGTVIGVIALGMSFVIFAGQIDISVGSQVAIISGLGIVVLNKTQNIAVMLLFCLVFGIVLGSVNGMLVSFGKMPAMIATLAMQSACRSIITWLGQGGPFTVDPQSGVYEPFRQIGVGSISIGSIKIPYMMIIFIVMAFLFHLLATRTTVGKHTFAVGSNEKAARLSGVSIHKTKILVFVITGVMCGLGAFLQASRLTSIQPSNAGLGYEMEAIGAVAIGGAAMDGGKGKIVGTFFGVLMFRMINNILVAADVSPFLTGVVSAIILVVAVLLQTFQNRDK